MRDDLFSRVTSKGMASAQSYSVTMDYVLTVLTINSRPPIPLRVVDQSLSKAGCLSLDGHVAHHIV